MRMLRRSRMGRCRRKMPVPMMRELRTRELTRPGRRKLLVRKKQEQRMLGLKVQRRPRLVRMR